MPKNIVAPSCTEDNKLLYFKYIYTDLLRLHHVEPSASVGGIALANGVNANQVLRWKRQYERGELQPRRLKPSAALVLVTIAAEREVPSWSSPRHRHLRCRVGSVRLRLSGQAR